LMDSISGMLSPVDGFHPTLPLAAASEFGSLFGSVTGNSVLGILTNILGALLILAIGWIVSGWVAGFTKQLLKKTSFDDRLASMVAGRGRTRPNIEGIIASIAKWIVRILAIVAALNVLNLTTVSQPLTNFLTTILNFIPRIGAAIAIGAAAWFIANLVKGWVVEFADSFDLDARVNSASNEQASAVSIADSLGNAAYCFVLLFFLPIMLGVLGLEGPLAPVQALLNQILSAIPKILTAAVILTVAYFVGQIIAGLVTNLLMAAGFDNLVKQLGLTKQGAQSPAKLLGTIAMIATIFVALIPAVDVLGLPAMQNLVTNLLQIAGQVLVGVLFFGAGLFVANWVADLINGSGVKESGLLATAARVAIIAFSGAMALNRIGVASEIVNLTFGLLLGAIAVALAIAFGLGGRDVAGEQLRDWVKPFKR
jgi:Conserved TM helix